MKEDKEAYTIEHGSAGFFAFPVAASKGHS